VPSLLQTAVEKHRAGDLAEAEKIYRQVLEGDANNADALHLLGLVLHQHGDQDAAGENIERAIRLRPKQAEFYCKLGKVRAAQEHWSDAVSANKKAIESKPDYAAAHCNLGVALLWQGRPAAAEETLRESLKCDDKSAQANEAWEKAIILQPNFAEAHYNLAASKLVEMDFARGWQEFAWRGRADPQSFSPDADGYPFSLPRWNGEALSGKSIFLWGEQGLGDQVLFSGLLPQLEASGARILVEVEPRLKDLYERSFPGMDVFARDRPLSDALSAAVFDVQCPLGDLGQFLRPSPDSFPVHSGYLKAEPDRVAGLKSKYAKLGTGKPVVGISWRSPRKRFGALKSTDLAESWSEVLAVPDVTFVSLQYGPVTEALARAEQRHGVKVHHDPDIDATRDIDGLAAQIAAMDLVVSVSNTTVHLAGALGVPVWTVAPSGAGRLWYWFKGLETSPWYPSMRLFQQDKPGDWGPVLSQVATALARHF